MAYNLTLALILLVTPLFSQGPLHTRYTRYSAENGLPQNLVSGVVQDDDGFVWVSTLDGLARFDGREFLVFRHQPQDSLSLTFNTINGLFKDDQNNIWVRFDANQSVNKIDPRTFEISKPRLTEVPREIFLERDQKLVGSQLGFRGSPGSWLFFKYDKDQKRVNVLVADTTNKLTAFLGRQKPPRQNKILAIREDRHGKMWAVTKQGMEVYDSGRVDYQNIPFPKPIIYDPEEAFTMPVHLHHLNGERIVTAFNRTLLVYNARTGTFKEITPKLDELHHILDVTMDQQGRLVFAIGKEIMRLEDNDQLIRLWQYPGDQGIRNILIDKTSTLWVATDADGLYKVNLLTGAFQSRPYKDDFLTDVLVNEIGLSSKAIPKDAIVPGSAYHSRYTYSDQGLLLLVAQGQWENHLVLIKEKSMNVAYKAERNGPIAFHRGKLWLLDHSGLMHSWTNTDHRPETFKTDLPLNEFGVSSISGLLIEDNRFFALTPHEGIYEFQNNKLIKTFRPQGNYAAHILCNDPNQKNILWIGTISGGLYEWDKDQRKVMAVYNTGNGLPNNTINNIVPDAYGYLWMSTNRGITRFNPVARSFTNYSSSDGLIEAEFNRHHDLLLPDGRIAMGSIKGYSVFHPKDFVEDTTATEIKISGVTINGKAVAPNGTDALLPDPVNLLTEINLDYDNNSIGFEVAAMQYNDLDKNHYRYKLEGYDKEWVDNGPANRVRFNLLPHGDYTLLLNASNTAGIWSPKIKRIAIVVHPPFWLTWWAYVFYTIAVAFVVRTYWRGYKRRLRAKQEAEFNVREAARLRELDETKTRFFSNITHEFRTPLTLILSPLEKHLSDPTLSPKALTLLNNNYRHASQLLQLVNQLLDIAKLESGQMQMNLTAGELKTFARHCVSAFEAGAREKSISLELLCDNIDGHYLFDRDKLEKIVFNLLSNALKFTPGGGKVVVNFSSAANATEQDLRLVIKVIDSGIGIDDHQLEKIFERFYQADDSATRTYEGTGIGLALVKELVELMKGKIEVDSVKGRGSTFTIELPIQRITKVPEPREVTTINGFEILPDEHVPGIDHDLPLLLVVEDNDELRSFVCESLATNWNVKEAANGFDGWTIIEQELPEIVITDVMMPGMSGFELCAKSKKDPRTAHINFIVLTAKAAQESRIEGLESGADEYITKPFQLYELELRIRNLLVEQHNLRRHLSEKVLPTTPRAQLPHVSDLFLVKLKDFLDENLDNSELNIDAIASALAMSKSTLNRKMRALLDVSVNEYVRQYRLQKAITFLASGCNIAEASTKVGFQTASYFAQCFKEVYHQTPTDFLKQKD